MLLTKAREKEQHRAAGSHLNCSAFNRNPCMAESLTAALNTPYLHNYWQSNSEYMYGASCALSYSNKFSQRLGPFG